jgi:hypothetical protein
MISSRKYVKRIWRVPRDRGPVEYFATLCVKMLVKHGWPAKWVAAAHDQSSAFDIVHVDLGVDAPFDFWSAVETAVRILARTYRVDVVCHKGFVTFHTFYTVNRHGVFREVKDDPTG